jgi:hypothetical protein
VVRRIYLYPSYACGLDLRIISFSP